MRSQAWPPPEEITGIVMPERRRSRRPWANRLRYVQLRLATFLLDLFFVAYLYWAWGYVADHVTLVSLWRPSWPWWVTACLILEVTVLWESTTRSLGARIMGMDLITADGRRPGLGRRLIRFLAWNVSLVPLALGHLWALGDRAWLTWTDRLSGVLVLAAEREREERTRRPPAWYATPWGVAAIAFLLLSYGVGWIITEINPTVLLTDAHLVRPLVKELLRPEILTREKRTQRVVADFQIPCPEGGVAPGEIVEGRPQLLIEPACGEPGTQVTIRAFNLHPDTVAQIRWLDPLGNATRLSAARTDAEGQFTLTFEVPPTAITGQTGLFGAEALLSWEEGELKISETAIQVKDKMLETIFLALMATTLGVIFAVPVSFLAARNLMARHPVGAAIYYLVRLTLNILRAIEPLIWAIIFAVWVGIGPYAGVLALTLHSIAALGKLYSEAIENIDPGPIEAVTATGANRLQTIVYAVVPQVIPPFIAFTIYRWDINVRMSTVIGFVGGGGIGFLLIQWINLLQYRQAATAVWAIAIVVSIMDYLSAIIRERVV
ncbi:MAG: hypothetical protein Kow0047_01100 [Anaerolineae bacterium]